LEPKLTQDNYQNPHSVENENSGARSLIPQISTGEITGVFRAKVWKAVLVCGTSPARPLAIRPDALTSRDREYLRS
jgi:hypothetical protein